jgi:methylase of polypeptide subunit release factors
LIDEWVAALQTRHRASLTTPEFLKAVRALSARYVERRSELASRSPLDSAGKRAAFAAFYAPLHFLTVREIVRALAATQVARIVDLGCGTGAASAAWARDDEAKPPDDAVLGAGRRVLLSGIDSNAWAVDECRWNWRQLGARGDVRRGDLVRAAESLHSTSGRLKPAPTSVYGCAFRQG